MSKSVSLQLVCRGCGKSFRTTLRGNTTRCPHCHAPRHVPINQDWEGSKASPASSAPALSRDPVEVACGFCGHTWQSWAASGQSVRCPKCHHSRRVPARSKARQAPTRQAPGRTTPVKQAPIRQVQAKRPAKQSAKQSLKQAFKQSITHPQTRQPSRQPIRQSPARQPVRQDPGPAATPALVNQVALLLRALQKPPSASPAPTRAAPVPTTSVQDRVAQSLFPTRPTPFAVPVRAPSANSTNALLEKFGPWSVSPHSARGQCAIQTATGHGAVRSGGCESVSTHVAHLGSKAAVPVCPSHAFALCAKADSTGLPLRLTPLVAGTLFGLPEKYLAKG
jgi:DNA-directed RNA polymerase subunit RPC12/RpoP